VVLTILLCSWDVWGWFIDMIRRCAIITRLTTSLFYWACFTWFFPLGSCTLNWSTIRLLVILNRIYAYFLILINFIVFFFVFIFIIIFRFFLLLWWSSLKFTRWLEWRCFFHWWSSWLICPWLICLGLVGVWNLNRLSSWLRIGKLIDRICLF
jgi:hypothetical protein